MANSLDFIGRTKGFSPKVSPMLYYIFIIIIICCHISTSIWQSPLKLSVYDNKNHLFALRDFVVKNLGIPWLETVAWVSQLNVCQGCSYLKASMVWRICFQSGLLTWLSDWCCLENLSCSPCEALHRDTWTFSQYGGWLLPDKVI